MEAFLNQYGYIALFIGTFFEGETAILVASSLIHSGLFSFLQTIFFGFAGSFISDWMYYGIGKLNGKYFIDHRPKLKAKVEPVQKFFLKHQLQILLSYRFLYGFRILIPVVIGMSGIKPFRYLVFTIISGLIWSISVSSVGYAIGKFLNVRTQAYEENILFIVLGFASFGMVIGYIIKTITMRKMSVVE